MRKTLNLHFIGIATASLLALFSQVYASGTANMYLSLGSKTVEVGENLVVNIGINPGTDVVDTARAEISYPANLLSVISVTPTGSLTSPSPGNQTSSPGHISWGAFTVGEPIASPSSFARISFKAKAGGNATISLDSSRLIHEGEEVGNGFGGQTSVTISPSTKSAADLLALTSPTHPDQTKWYQADNVTLQWSAGSSASYLVDLDNAPDTAPTKSATGNSKQYKNVKSGTWYFHLSPASDNSIAHYKLQIDNIKPNPIEPYLDISNKQDLTVKFSTTDYHSGIASYDVQVNGDATENVTSPFALRGLAVGSNRVTITAYDLAGNARSGWVKFILDGDGTVHDITTSGANSSVCDAIPGICTIPLWGYLLGLLGILLILALLFRNRVGVLNVETVTKTNLGTVSKTITKTDPKTGKKLVTKTVTKTDTKNVVETDTGKISAEEADKENNDKTN